MSIDTKATIKIGPFSRGGYSRQGSKGSDHDFEPEATLKLFGIHVPEKDENYLYFTESNVTADFMVDAIEDLWTSLENQTDLHTIVINADNGSENSSRRTQFIKRIVEFAKNKSIDVQLVYYPPYHSKFNPVERKFNTAVFRSLGPPNFGILANQRYNVQKKPFDQVKMIQTAKKIKHQSPGKRTSIF